MLWYNSKTNELQSSPPWGASYLAPELIGEQYADWGQVANDFVPAAAQPTKAQKLAALKAEYDPQIQNIQIQIAVAVSATKNTTAEATLRQAMTALQTEYNEKRMVIING